MALVGNMLAIALENPRQAGALPPTQIMFFDVSDLAAPVFRSQFTPINGAGEARPSAGVVAVTPLPGGRYLMMSTGGEHNTTWYFYRSTLTDLSSPDLSWDLLGHVPSPFDDPDDTDAHQTLTFLRQGNIDGPLYLAGARGHPAFGDHDRIDLFYVEYQPPESAGGESVALLPGGLTGTPIEPYPNGFGLIKLANLAAASGFHVTPSGELIFYATEHDNDGPDGTVKAGEWRHVEVVRRDSPTLLPTVLVNGPYEVDEGRTVDLAGSAGPPATRAFLQMFSGLGYGGFSLIADIDDITLEAFDSLNDFALSWNWYAPAGCTAFAVDSHPPAAKTLPGSGEHRARSRPQAGPERRRHHLHGSEDR